MSQIITSLAEISPRYKALFVDLWGCVHNGITAYPDAVAALKAYRANGGLVVLVTNSPKPRAGVAEQLGDFGVPSDAYDTIATSGDSARSAMFQGAVGEKVYFMGEPARDEGRDEIERCYQRRQQRNHHRERLVAKDLSGDTFHEDDRKEHRHRRQGRSRHG